MSKRSSTVLAALAALTLCAPASAAGSSPLAMLGAPDEDETREGVAYLHWTGESFEQLRFIPVKALCSKTHD